jgi:hypothetical protein
MLAFLPSTNNPQVGEQVNRSRRQLGNTVGAVLSALGLLGILFLAWAAVLTFGEDSAMWHTWPQLLEDFVILSPYLVVELVGMALALALWRRHPQVSLLALLAFGLTFTAVVVGIFVFAWLPLYLMDGCGWSYPQTMPVITGIALLRNLVVAAATILLLFAVFTGRSHTGGARQLSGESGDSESQNITEVELA